MILMKNYLFTFRSVTYAQKGERTLKRAGIDCFIRRTPKALTSRECGYSLQIRPWDYERALVHLRDGKVQFGKAYGMDYEGRFEEITL